VTGDPTSTQTVPVRGDSSGDRLLGVLALFTLDRPGWTVEAAAEALGVSPATTYRYFKRLTTAGLLSPVSGANYMLGPAIIQMDRQIQICDPMLNAARKTMLDLITHVERSTVLLCRMFHDRVMCVHQVMGRGPQQPVSYERGRLMPLFRGATSKVILAHVPARTLRGLYSRYETEIAEASLGKTWEELRRALSVLRRAGFCISSGEIDPGRLGIAAPVFDKDHAMLGSLSFVLPADAPKEQVREMTELTVAGAREIERVMHGSQDNQPGPARIKIGR
jgi:DNA-binding IclR family transcriptional regulator